MATERSVLVRLGLDPKGFVAGTKVAGAALKDLRKDIDTTNDRTAWLAQSFLALGPAIGPLGAAVVPALSGMATQLTATALAGGVLTIAMNGVGDALKALNDYQIDPTDAHFKKLHQTMAFIGPTGRDLVRVLDDMRNGFIGLSNLARDNMFPGVIDGLKELRDLTPQVEQIVAKTANVLGDLTSRAGESLGGPKFEDFFKFLEAEAVPTLDAMGRTIGNFADGLAAMLVAFAPLSRDFTGGMLEMSRSFAAWAHGLQDNQSFQDFVDYIRENTPRVMDLLDQLSHTFLAIVEAASPVGEVMVPILTEILKVVELLVDSPLGPIFIAAAAAMSLYGRAVALATITTGGLGKKVAELAFGVKRLSDAERIAAGTNAKWKVGIGNSIVTLGAFALAASPIPEKLGLTNTALGAMTGSMAGPWGAAVGAGVGLMFDLSKTSEAFVVTSDDLLSTLNQQTGDITKNTREWVANEAARQGILTAARTLGINLETLTDAMLGDSLAIERVNRAIDGTVASLTDADGQSRVSADVRDDYRVAVDKVTQAVGNTNDALTEGRDRMLLVDEAVGTTARKFRKAADSVDYFGLAVTDLNAKLDKRASLRDYEAAIDDVARAARENGKTLDIQSQKGRDNQATLDALAQTISDVANTMTGTSRTEFLKKGREDFVDAAIKMGKSEKAARDLAKELGIVGLIHAKPAIAPQGVEKTFSEIDKIQDKLIILDNFVATPHITTVRDTNWNYGEGPGFADGGYTGPGGKYEPAGIVHRGEFVFDQATTARNRGLFEAIHKGMAGYANGGYVAATAQPTSAAMPGIDYDRLVGALLSARPMYGNVHVNGDPTVWRKQMEDDARAASAGKLGG